MNAHFKALLIASSLFITYCGDAQDYKKLHNKSIVVDSHNDILTAAFERNVSFGQNLKGITHSDLNRMKEGGIDVQVFSVYCDGMQINPYAYANRQMDTLYAWAKRNPTKMMIVKTPADLKAAVKQQQLAAMMGVEGGHMIEDDLNKLDTLFNRGARYMTLTWNNSTNWATSAKDETEKKPDSVGQQKGLNDFGRKVISRMNELGMMVDLSHVGEQTFWDAISVTTKPVIVSHSSCYSLCPVFRNLKDDQIKAVGKNGGVIHVNFFSAFLDSSFFPRINSIVKAHQHEIDSLVKINSYDYFVTDYLQANYPNEVAPTRAPLSLLLDHIDHIVQLIGVDHVGLGSDFDGITSTPQQLDDVTNLPLVTRELLARGYSKKDIQKILGGNFIRLFKANMEK